MVTHSRDGRTKPTNRFTLHVSSLSPLPKSHIQASQNLHWQNAMQDEFNTLVKNGTWVLVPRPPNVNVVRSMRLFKHKFNVDETLSSPVVKPATIRTVLNLAVSHQWPIHQLDVKNTFLHGHLTEIHASTTSKTDSSRFIFQRGVDTTYLLIYVDDIILTTSSLAFLQRIISSLHEEFAMTDLGPLNYFLGIAATRTSDCIFLSQTKYATEILERAHMLNFNPCRTPVDTEKKLGPEGSPIADPTLYRTTRRSTLGYYVFLGDNLLTWSSKRQETLSRSGAEAKYQGVANAVAETSWVRNLFRELHTPLSTATLVYCDNVSAVYMSANPVQHQRTKHIEIDIYFVRDKVVAGHVRILHVLSRFQYADIFTKGLPYQLFADFWSSLSVRASPAPTARVY
ncbi:ribonuclease H-like domain-containing protein [Tanacetum coccineum]